MMETMLRSILGRMNGTYWSQLKVQLAILMMIMCIVDLCSAAPYQERSEDHNSVWNNLLKGLTIVTHAFHLYFATATAAQTGSRSNRQKICIVFTHIIFWIAGHAAVHHRTDVHVEQVFEWHISHGYIRAGYTFVSIIVAVISDV
eukprot:scpid94233/ scgid32580/ 